MPWQAPAKTKTQRPWPAVGAEAPGPRAHGGGCGQPARTRGPLLANGRTVEGAPPPLAARAPPPTTSGPAAATYTHRHRADGAPAHQGGAPAANERKRLGPTLGDWDVRKNARKLPAEPRAAHQQRRSTGRPGGQISPPSPPPLLLRTEMGGMVFIKTMSPRLASAPCTRMSFILSR